MTIIELVLVCCPVLCQSCREHAQTHAQVDLQVLEGEETLDTNKTLAPQVKTSEPGTTDQRRKGGIASVSRLVSTNSDLHHGETPLRAI